MPILPCFRGVLDNRSVESLDFTINRPFLHETVWNVEREYHINHCLVWIHRVSCWLRDLINLLLDMVISLVAVCCKTAMLS